MNYFVADDYSAVCFRFVYKDVRFVFSFTIVIKVMGEGLKYLNSKVDMLF